MPSSSPPSDAAVRAGDRAVALSGVGYCCAEAVLMAIAEQRGLSSPMIPAVASGFCSGAGESSGMCGALTGGILAINLTLGRSQASQSREPSYRAVRQLIEAFRAQHRVTGCTELLGRDLGTAWGRLSAQLAGVRAAQCVGYSRLCAELATDILEREKPR